MLWHLETSGRDRADKDEYKLRADVSFCISNTVNVIEYYHNSSFLEHGGSPDKAVRAAFVWAVDRYLKSTGKYTKNESKINFSDIEDCSDSRLEQPVDADVVRESDEKGDKQQLHRRSQ